MPCYFPLRLPHLDHAVPCGRCIGCRLERARQWAVRCWQEAQQHEENSFLTLTLNDDSLVWGEHRPTLDPNHLTLFWKRLRKAVRKKYGIKRLQYFACGEYGGITNRPHYHACVFGLDFPDKTLHSTKGGNRLYRSDFLDSVWGHGHCLIGAVTFESAAYVARYIVDKKLGNSAKYYTDESIEPEFVRMSRRPAIGLSHFDKYKSDIYPHDYCIVNSVKSKPPRYYDNLLKKSDINTYEKIKLNRKLKSSVISPYEKMPKRLSVKNRIALNRLKKIARDSV